MMDSDLSISPSFNDLIVMYKQSFLWSLAEFCSYLFHFFLGVSLYEKEDANISYI